MLIMMNTTRPERDNILTRYNCTECGMWCTVIYEPKSIEWHVSPTPGSSTEKIKIDPDIANEGMYFVEGKKGWIERKGLDA